MTCNRRGFLQVSAAAMAVPGVRAEAAGLTGILEAWDPARPFTAVSRPLRVQPVFMYRIAQPRERASWKSWGAILSEDAARQEMARIEGELRLLAKPGGPPLEFLPVAPVSSPEAAAQIHSREHDVILLYACIGGGQLLQACCSPRRDTVIFVRHRSGPVYYWYEALSSRYLTGRLHPDDVVVDDAGELLAKLRGLAGANNLRGTKIVALGGPMGKYSPDAPEVARSRYGIEIINTGYDDFGKRIKAALADARVTAAAGECTRRYLRMPGTTMRTETSFVANGFVLYALFKQLMAEYGAQAFTVKDCMSTIIPMSSTTACLTLGLMCDEGLPAFCESDFVIIPAGILLRHVSGLPVFLHNSSFPHKRMVTCAHCAAPRRMNGRDYCPAIITTHYESEYGAAPKVEIPPGQQVTFIDPEYATGRWLGFNGIVRGNPSYEICRSQQDVEILGKWELLKHEARDSHWVMAYGDCLAEAEYGARKLGVRWSGIAD